MSVRRYGPYTVSVSKPDKLLFPADGITKAELVDYYDAVADRMLPHLAGRALSVQRFPDGIEKAGFFQKSASSWFPAWIRTAELAKEDGVVRHVVAENRATLAYLADQACVTLHAPLSRVDRPEHPDRLVVDLDPSGRAGFGEVRRAARLVAELLDELGLAVFLQTTGSRGLHVVSPLDRKADFDLARDFAHELAELLAAREPDLLTVEPRKVQRGDRIYLDVGRNAYAQTAVAPYSVRARPGAPVATPIERAELDARDLRPDGWSLRTVLARLAERGDPWQGIGRRARGLAGPRARLADLGGAAQDGAARGNGRANGHSR